MIIKNREDLLKQIEVERNNIRVAKTEFFGEIKLVRYRLESYLVNAALSKVISLF